MEQLKKGILPFLLCLLLVVIAWNSKHITTSIANMLEKKPEIVIMPTNKYTKNYDFQFVKKTEDFIPYSRQDLLNIFFTTINNGWGTFTFYCPNEYSECTNDVIKISEDEELLTHINNYVHPYNSFININTGWNNLGEITIKITKSYTKEQIKAIDQKVDDVIIRVVKDDMEIEEKIKAIHDYIIDHAEYDLTYDPESETNTYHSNIAYGPLLEANAICNGYTDAMAIFLSKLGIQNYKIAAKNEKNETDDDKVEGHVWNAVKIEDQWYHLDLTWDDPVSESGKPYLRHKYFLITNEELKKADEGETQIDDHKFKASYYLEFK